MSNGTATCNYMGRTGNRLFQMAATIGYALDHNKQFVFPKWEWQKYMPVKEGEIKGTLVVEESLRYTRFPFVEGDVTIHGHLLSTKYFNHHKKYIVEYFKLTPEWEEYIEKKYERLFLANTCSIHIRRGDFMLPEQMACQGLMPLEYYNEAIGKIWDTPYNEWLFIVCSDDIPWCKENFKGEHFYFIENEPAIIDLFIMSMCNDNIISNSSFGWWAAYLNQSPNKRVVAPRQWFKDTEGWDDLYEKNWIKI
ncbi:MAG: hypothetical protein A2Z57_12095 [Planctomycetes bacterium RIFCSPHIGHO2_12_39_6]|nr:MAG: hypothetical protein A2Z57_12095 [Planctomycetes bacterium RIFCSPHIGHO2_12_39_6]